MRLLPLALLVFGTACVDRAGRAREQLAKQGLTVTAFAREGEGFRFAGIRDGQRCTGTIDVHANWTGTRVGYNTSMNCAPEAGP